MRYYDTTSFDPYQSVGYLVRRAHQIGVAALEPIFAEEGLTGIQWSALVLIYLGHCTTGADVARDLSYDKGATTRLIDTLEERGWVVRRRCTADRRIVNLDITADGSAVALRCKRRVIACWNRWLDGWAESEVTTLILLLQKLRTTLDTATTAGACA